MVKLKKKTNHFAEGEVLKKFNVSNDNLEFMFSKYIFLNIQSHKICIMEIPAKKKGKTAL